MSEQISDSGFASHCSIQSRLTRFTSKKRNNAETTPISAPPAMNPLAMSVPFSLRSRFTSAFLERVLTYQLTMPPTRSGIFSSSGMNIPRAKAMAGMPQNVSITAITAPIA